MIRVVMAQEKLFHSGDGGKGNCVIDGGMAPSSSLHVFFTGELRIMQQHIGSFGDVKAGDPFGIACYSIPSKGRLMIGYISKDSLLFLDAVADGWAGMNNIAGLNFERTCSETAVADFM